MEILKNSISPRNEKKYFSGSFLILNNFNKIFSKVSIIQIS